jgi:hypothetical protein
MNRTHIRTESLEQISVADGTRKALLTRFLGERGRVWSVVGFDTYLGSFSVRCHNGPCDKFTKRDAEEMALRWVQRGWDYL